MNSLKRGALIVIEGVDRSGKSTQCKKLVESLKVNNIQANLITFPDRTTVIGGIIDKYLKQESNLCDEAIHLMFTANRWEKREEMERLLTSGVTLVVDRYSYSGIVYSSVKKNMLLNWCQEPEKGLIKPDRVFLLTLPEDVMEKRPDYGSERYENKATQKAVARAFAEMSSNSRDWEIISGEGDIDHVQKILLEKVLKIVTDVANKPLESLDFKTGY